MVHAIKITTLRTTDVHCPDNRSCPSIHAVAGEPDRRYVITKRITDPAVAAAFAYLVADDEQIGYVPTPADLIERDFWIIGHSIVVTMYYDQHGRLDGAEVANPGELADHLRTRDAAWAAAEPFAAWWARHPELHRKVAA